MDRIRVVVHRARLYMAGQVLESEVVKMFIEGSKNDKFREWAEGKFASGTLSLAGALERACAYELSMKVKNSKSSPSRVEQTEQKIREPDPLVTSTCSTDSTEAVNAVRLGSFRNRFRGNPRFSGTSRDPRACYKCGLRGHHQAQCLQGRGFPPSIQGTRFGNRPNDQWRPQQDLKPIEEKTPDKPTVSPVNAEAESTLQAADHLNVQGAGNATTTQSQF